jgi:hypothetical protein
MTNFRTVASAGLALAFAFTALGGCERKEGPAERAGKQVGESVGKAGRSVDDAVDTAGRKIERAGEKLQDASRDAKK